MTFAREGSRTDLLRYRTISVESRTDLLHCRTSTMEHRTNLMCYRTVRVKYHIESLTLTGKH